MSTMGIIEHDGICKNGTRCLQHCCIVSLMLGEMGIHGPGFPTAHEAMQCMVTSGYRHNQQVMDLMAEVMELEDTGFPRYILKNWVRFLDLAKELHIKMMAMERVQQVHIPIISEGRIISE